MSNNIKKLPKFFWERSIWFFDVDDTLIDFSGTTGLATQRVQEVLSRHFSLAVAENLTDRFDHFFSVLRMVHQSEGDLTVPEHDELLARITRVQLNISKQYGFVKQWSREVLLKLAADDLGISVTPELVHEAVDAYWMTLSKESTILPGVSGLLAALQEQQRPFYLLTSSDGRLKMADDGTFSYLPEYSEGLKRERMELLRPKGIPYHGLSIGDPEDKPHADFFQKGIHMAEQDLGLAIDPKYAVMVGDSFTADLQTPREQLGFGLVILVDRTAQKLRIVDDRHIVTNNLGAVVSTLEQST